MGPPVVTFLILLGQNMVYNFIYLTEFSGTKFSYSWAGARGEQTQNGSRWEMGYILMILVTVKHKLACWQNVFPASLQENHYDVSSLSWTCRCNFLRTSSLAFVFFLFFFYLHRLHLLISWHAIVETTDLSVERFRHFAGSKLACATEAVKTRNARVRLI